MNLISADHLSYFVYLLRWYYCTKLNNYAVKYVFFIENALKGEISIYLHFYVMS